jgi:hypothetical protein
MSIVDEVKKITNDNKQVFKSPFALDEKFAKGHNELIKRGWIKQSSYQLASIKQPNMVCFNFFD